MPNPVIATGVRSSYGAKAISTASAGVLVTYTTPANRRATITSFFNDNLNGLVAMSFELNISAQTYRPQGTAPAGAPTRVLTADLQLQPGHAASWTVTTAVAATAADIYIGWMEEA